MSEVVIGGKKYTESEIFREKEEYIKLEAIDLCFALNQLAKDSSALIRAAVARKKVAHEQLARDKSWRVRATVAKYTDTEDVLDILAKDENDFVRFVVVKRGYKLNAFINDRDEEIASIARFQIQNQSLKFNG